MNAKFWIIIVLGIFSNKSKNLIKKILPKLLQRFISYIEGVRGKKLIKSILNFAEKNEIHHKKNIYEQLQVENKKLRELITLMSSQIEKLEKNYVINLKSDNLSEP